MFWCLVCLGSEDGMRIVYALHPLQFQHYWKLFLKLKAECLNRTLKTVNRIRSWKKIRGILYNFSVQCSFLPAKIEQFHAWPESSVHLEDVQEAGICCFRTVGKLWIRDKKRNFGTQNIFIMYKIGGSIFWEKKENLKEKDLKMWRRSFQGSCGTFECLEVVGGETRKVRRRSWDGNWNFSRRSEDSKVFRWLWRIYGIEKLTTRVVTLDDSFLPNKTPVTFHIESNYNCH